MSNLEASSNRAQTPPQSAPNIGPHNGQVPHGNCCDCVILAAAVGAGPKAIPFEYCLKVLKRHWLLTCMHGEVLDAPPEKKASEKWHNYGEMAGPIKALLIKNS